MRLTLPSGFRELALTGEQAEVAPVGHSTPAGRSGEFYGDLDRTTWVAQNVNHDLTTWHDTEQQARNAAGDSKGTIVWRMHD